MTGALIQESISDEPLSFFPPDLREKWRKVRGWLLLDGARKLYEASATAPPGGRIVEIGSFAGKSTLCIAWAKRENSSKTTPPVVAIDPKFQADFKSNLAAFGIGQDIVESKEADSISVADQWNQPISFLYIDGHHGIAHAIADFTAWEPYVQKDCIIALDDTAGHGIGPVRLVRTALTSGAFDRLYEVDGITFLRKNRSLFPGLGRFPPERESVIADLASVSGWTAAMDPDLLPPCAPGENLATVDMQQRQRQARWLQARYKTSAVVAESPDLSLTMDYIAAIILIQIREFESAISILNKLEASVGGVQFATHALPLLPFVMLRLGQCYDLSGQREKAVRYYEALQSESVSELRETADRFLKAPFAFPALRNDLLMREYITAGVFAKYRTY